MMAFFMLWGMGHQFLTAHNNYLFPGILCEQGHGRQQDGQ